jgi:hypothetical protein
VPYKEDKRRTMLVAVARAYKSDEAFMLGLLAICALAGMYLALAMSSDLTQLVSMLPG